ncbi:unnamed protein product [Pieris macdunnoughi]|uniref:Uncharacterized protein n=1 Tax=Pieris macdunnoughi TaxID=345717 RepID=A0A821T0K6_9NEOP|nr:unnamed protein product [Pieris macdunnoughi]
MLQLRCSRANCSRACRWPAVNLGPVAGLFGVRLASFRLLLAIHSLTAIPRTRLSSPCTSTPVRCRFRREVETMKRSSRSEVQRLRLVVGLRVNAPVSCLSSVYSGYSRLTQVKLGSDYSLTESLLQ